MAFTAFGGTVHPLAYTHTPTCAHVHVTDKNSAELGSSPVDRKKLNQYSNDATPYRSINCHVINGCSRRGTAVKWTAPCSYLPVVTRVFLVPGVSDLGNTRWTTQHDTSQRAVHLVRPPKNSCTRLMACTGIGTVSFRTLCISRQGQIARCP